MISNSTLFSLALALFTATAHAEIRTFSFTGTVTESLPMAPAGTRVFGTFSYDTSSVPYMQSGEPAGPGYGDASYLAQGNIRLTVNGHTATAGVTTVYVVNNGGGNVEDAISVSGELLTLDGTFFGEGTFGFYLGSGPGNQGVLSSTRLPQTIPARRFDGMNYGWVNVNGGPNGTVLSFAIDRVVPNDGGQYQSE